MDRDVRISRRGVYYDVTMSPYEFNSPYGDIFKFSSAKKLEIYTRDVEKELKRLEAFLERNELRTFIPHEIGELLKRSVYCSFYRKVER